MKNEKRVSLEEKDWTEIQMMYEDYDMCNLSESEKTNLKMIFAKIAFQLRGSNYCSHEYGKITASHMVAMATLEQPAEYEYDGICLICGNDVNPDDIENIID